MARRRRTLDRIALRAAYEAPEAREAEQRELESDQEWQEEDALPSLSAAQWNSCCSLARLAPSFFHARDARRVLLSFLAGCAARGVLLVGGESAGLYTEATAALEAFAAGVVDTEEFSRQSQLALDDYASRDWSSLSDEMDDSYWSDEVWAQEAGGAAASVVREAVLAARRWATEAPPVSGDLEVVLSVARTARLAVCLTKQAIWGTLQWDRIDRREQRRQCDLVRRLLA